MIRIAVVTATRAEYGLLRPFLKEISQDKEFNLKLLVTGTHLSFEHGMTVTEIENDGLKVDYEIETLSDKKGPQGIAETMSNAIISFTDILVNEKFDCIFIDGDRYEMLAIAIAAVNSDIPVIHNGGGAVSEGALDDYWRHAITKLSYLHFTSTSIYRNRIIQMGENPSRVFEVGSLGIENIRTMKLLSKNQLALEIGFDISRPYGVVTFHPATKQVGEIESQVNALLQACEKNRDMAFIFTKANADNGGEIVNNILVQYVEQHRDSSTCVASLGSLRYLSAIKYCEFVIGNSSSGLIEAPSFGVPTIDVGDRQKGRIKAGSVISCEASYAKIVEAIERARSKSFKQFCKSVENPNGDGYTSKKMINIIKNFFINGGKHEKSFYDIL